MAVGETTVRETQERAHRAKSEQEALGAAARKVSQLVGDGCLIRLRDRLSGELLAVAAHHLDPAAADLARAALPLPGDRGWIAQALERDCVLRLPTDAANLAEAGIPPELSVSDAIVVPIAGAEAAIIALRGEASAEFSFADRLALERIAADLGQALDRPPAPVSNASEAQTAQHELSVDPHHLLDSIAAGVWLIDELGRTTWVNEMASELVGIPANELIGAPVPEFVAGADGAFGEGLHADQRTDRKLRRPDGREIWLSATARPLFDGEGSAAGTLLTLVDIDARKRREVDLRIKLQAEQALIELAQSSLDAPHPRAIFTEAAQVIVEQLGTALVAVSTVDRRDSELRVVAAVAEDESWANELCNSGPFPLAETSFSLAALDHSSSVVVDDFAVEDSDPRLEERGIRSGAFVPLGDGESVLGVLSAEPAGFDAPALRLVESVARMVANYQALLAQARAPQCGASASPGMDPGCDHQPAKRRRRASRRRPGLS